MNLESSNSRPFLSIIVPAYNEGMRLPKTLPQITHFVASQDYEIEVIVVNNNSGDNTRQIAEKFAKQFPYIRVLDEPRQGKGAAVKTGLLAGRGDYLFIADADLSMPIEEVNKFLPPTVTPYDVAIGSREAPGAVRYDEPEYRHLMGRVFNTIVRLLAVPGFQDTQAGFKCFHRDAAQKIVAKQTIDGWAFDVELLYIALRMKMNVLEIPIAWHYRPNSRISPLRDSIEMVKEVLAIRRKGTLGQYD